MLFFCDLKDTAISKKKTRRKTEYFCLKNKILRERHRFVKKHGIVNLYPFSRTLWRAYKVENFFDFQGCPPAKMKNIFSMKKKDNFSEWEVQEKKSVWFLPSMHFLTYQILRNRFRTFCITFNLLLKSHKKRMR